MSSFWNMTPYSIMIQRPFKCEFLLHRLNIWSCFQLMMMMMRLCRSGLDEVLRVLSVRPESRLWDHWPSVWRCVCLCFYLCTCGMFRFSCLTVWFSSCVCVFQVGRCFSGNLCTVSWKTPSTAAASITCVTCGSFARTYSSSLTLNSSCSLTHTLVSRKHTLSRLRYTCPTPAA